MAFIDEVKIYARAGKGGDGVVRWRHEKGKELSGASGGNGGKGGDVYLKAVRELTLLASYRGHKPFQAERGVSGMKNSMHGKNGEDLFINVPLGSVVTNNKTGEVFRFDVEGEAKMVLKGGRGGVGNEFFKSSTNTSPYESTVGVAGEEAEFQISLEMFADVGLIGLPNAGKSSLLNALTGAHAKVGSYAFTTLEPNLGDMYGYIIADIPGLIEGTSDGKGLVHKFSKHIKKTKLLLHLISAENDDVKSVYKTVRDELKKFDKSLAEKEEIIVLSKSDTVSSIELQKKIKLLSKKDKKVFSVSVIDDESVKQFSDLLVKDLRQK